MPSERLKHSLRSLAKNSGQVDFDFKECLLEVTFQYFDDRIFAIIRRMVRGKSICIVGKSFLEIFAKICKKIGAIPDSTLTIKEFIESRELTCEAFTPRSKGEEIFYEQIVEDNFMAMDCLVDSVDINYDKLTKAFTRKQIAQRFAYRVKPKWLKK